MTNKHDIAKGALADIQRQAQEAAIESSDVMTALLSWLILEMKECSDIQDLPGLIRSELDSLGSGGVYELPRGGGHS